MSAPVIGDALENGAGVDEVAAAMRAVAHGIVPAGT